jgi:hypothetical protein
MNHRTVLRVSIAISAESTCGTADDHRGSKLIAPRWSERAPAAMIRSRQISTVMEDDANERQDH